MSPTVHAVADVGSNSARLLVVRPTDQGHLDVLADARVSLRLVRDLDAAGRLGRAAAQRTAATLLGFRVIARRHGARSMTVVATSAVRDATNSPAFVELVERESGQQVTVLSGSEEARLALVGAVSGLPVDSGTVVDLGGGSMEIAGFARRRFRSGVTLPLGALRLGAVHLMHDPPRADEVAALRADVAARLGDVDLAQVSADGGSVVGTGGTIRALSKAARGRVPPAISRLHGYELRRRDVNAVVERLSRLPASRRTSVAGISATRAESVLAGGLVVQVLMETLGAERILVSGYGVRQGVVLDQLGLASQRPRQVREASVSALVGRLRGGDATGSQRRRALVAALAPVVGALVEPTLIEAAGFAAALVDAGARLDHYGRWREAASLVTTADLDGFLHAELAALAAILLAAGDTVIPARARLAAELSETALRRAGTLLALADDIDRRLPAARAASLPSLRRDGRLVLGGMPAMLVPAALTARCRRWLHVDVRELCDPAHARSRGRRPLVALEFK